MAFLIDEIGEGSRLMNIFYTQLAKQCKEI